jgi:hypothetical protein
MQDDIVRRAYAAYFRSGGANHPNASNSGVFEYEGKDYVVLENVNGVLAVYRIRPSDGRLRLMKRPPKAVIDHDLYREYLKSKEQQKKKSAKTKKK